MRGFELGETVRTAAKGGPVIDMTSRNHPKDPDGPKSGQGTELPSLELQQLWFTMQRRAWSSLVVIPAHAGGSGVSIARALAAVAERHRRQVVALIPPRELLSLDELRTRVPSVRPLEATAQSQAVALEATLTVAESHTALAESLEGFLTKRVLSRSITGAHQPDPAYLSRARDSSVIEQLVKKPSADAARTSEAAEGLPETAQLIVALEPVVSNPLGIAVALTADAALLCVTLGETPLASAKWTIEMIGRERFIGCVVVRPS